MCVLCSWTIIVNCVETLLVILLLLRDWWLTTVISVMFEFLEYSLEHQVIAKKKKQNLSFNDLLLFTDVLCSY